METNSAAGQTGEVERRQRVAVAVVAGTGVVQVSVAAETAVGQAVAVLGIEGFVPVAVLGTEGVQAVAVLGIEGVVPVVVLEIEGVQAVAGTAEDQDAVVETGVVQVSAGAAVVQAAVDLGTGV
ncbi:MAG: hypothetical protein SGCHY_001480 [Lobulomycetales sp.]